MLFKKLCLMVLLVALIIVPAPAQARECSPGVSVSPGSGPAGSNFRITITCFNPGNDIHVHIAAPGNAVTWDQTYTFNGDIYFDLQTLASDPPGSYSVQVDDGYGTVVSTSFQVTGGSPPPSDPGNPGSPPPSDPNNPPSSNPNPDASPGEPAASEPEPPYVLPITDECLVAARENKGVNVRSVPTTEGEIINSLTPATPYTVVGYAAMPDGIWYEVSGGGWVASFVTQHTGPCDVLPSTYQATAPETASDDANSTTTIQAVMPKLFRHSVGMDKALNNCSQIKTEAQELPVYMQLDIAAMDDGCEYAQETLGTVVFSIAPQPVPLHISRAMLAQCPDLLPEFSALMDKLYNVSGWDYGQTWEQISGQLTTENACAYADQLRSGRIPDELWQGDLNTVVQLSAAVCLDVDAARVQTIINAANDLMFDPVGVAVNCNQIKILNSMGSSVPATTDLLETALRTCGYDNPLSIRQIQLLATMYNVNVARVLREADYHAFCADPTQTMYQYIDSNSRFKLPAVFADCPTQANVLASRSPEITGEELYTILHSGDACGWAAHFNNFGTYVPYVDIPECWNAELSTFVIDGEPLNLFSNEAYGWQQAFDILSQDDVCAVDPSAYQYEEDRDWDLIPDSADACPNEPGAGVDGCPIPFGPQGAANTPSTSVLLPQADVRLAAGEVRLLPYASPDYTANPANIFVPNVSDPNVVQAIIENGQLKLMGAAPGRTQVTLFFTDGALTESLIFNVEVITNTPPAVVPMADQTLTAGSTLTVPVYFANPNNNLLVITAQSEKPEIAVAFVSTAPQVIHEGFISLVGVAPGRATITVSIVSMGNTPTTASGTFTINVVAAGTAPAAEPPQLKPISDQTLPAQTQLAVQPEGATPTPLGNIAAASSNPQVVTAQFMNRAIVLTGIQPGVTSVTLVANNGTGSSSVTFTVTVTAAAAPEMAVPELNPVLVEGHPDQLINLIEFPAGWPEFDGRGVSSLGDAVFQAQPGGIYRLHKGEPVLLRDNGHYPVMNPTRPLVAFLTDEPMIWLLDLGQDIAAPLQIGQLAADYPPAWSPDGSMLYITLADGLYTYSIDTPQVAPQLLIPGGRAAVVSPDGRYLAFEMVQAGTPTIYVTALSNPAENRPLLEEGSACYGPQFASNSISLYFTCDVDGTLKMFHAGIKGVEPLEVGIANAQNPAPGPVEGIFAFDDGSTIYLATSDLSQITPLLRLSDRLLSRLRWHQEQQSAKG